MTFIQKAGTFSEALQWGWQKTINSALVVYRNLHSMVATQKISVRNLGGPWTILQAALMYARQGSACS